MDGVLLEQGEALRVVLLPVAGSACETAGVGSRSRGAPLPRLFPPAGSAAAAGQRWSHADVLRTALGPADVRRAYGDQLAALGWAKVDSGGAAGTLVETWAFEQHDDRLSGVLVVRSLDDERVAVYFEVTGGK